MNSKLATYSPLYAVITVTIDVCNLQYTGISTR